MGRKSIDCREFPSDMHCSVAISADSEDELMQIAVAHAISVHHHDDSPELREQLRSMFKDDSGSDSLQQATHGAASTRFGSLMNYLGTIKDSALHSHKWH